VITFDATKELVDFCRHNINYLIIILELLDVEMFIANGIKKIQEWGQPSM
jgi:hypothetical protein